jgi:hypothetical protein
MIESSATPQDGEDDDAPHVMQRILGIDVVTSVPA